MEITNQDIIKEETRMKIIGCKATRETTQLLKDMMPEVLKSQNILLNVGWSNIPVEKMAGFSTILNRKESVKNCADKVMMYRLFKEHGVPSVDFYDFNTIEGIKNFMKNGEFDDFVVPNGSQKKIMEKDDIVDDLDRYTYATRFEHKSIEYRVLMLKNKIFRVMKKNPHDTSEDLYHIDNCDFVAIKRKYLPVQVREACIKASQATGIDFCGIDVMVNTDGEVKVLEVNSGPSMNETSIEKFYKALKEELNIENEED